MSTDEYSEDVPDDDDLYGCGSSVTSGSLPPDPRTGSVASNPSYQNLGSSSNCSIAAIGMGGMNDNATTSNLTGQSSNQTMSQQQFDQTQDTNLQRQKRKYIRRKSPEERKRRGPRTKDLNAPRMPLNGYVRFLNANRERIKQENPELTFAEVTKKLAAEWSSMNPEDKKTYLDEAEKAKEIYLKELNEYQRSESYQEFMEMKQRSKMDQQQQQQQQQSILDMMSSSQVPQYNQQQQQTQYFNDQSHHHHLSPHHSGHQQYTPQYSHQTPPEYGQYANQNSNNNKYSQGPTGLVNAKTSNSSSSSSVASNPYQYYNNGVHHQPSSEVHHYSNQNNNSSSMMSSYNGPPGTSTMIHNHYHQNYSMPQPSILEYGQNYTTAQQTVSNSHNHQITDATNTITSTDTNSNSLAAILEKSPPNSIIDLPIFTEEFLEHNKMREQELRNIRSFTMDYEEANAISSKHIDDMIKASDRLAAEEEKERETQSRLKTILERLQQALVEHLSRHISQIPPELVFESSSSEDNINRPENDYEYGPVTLENLDRFMETLNKVQKNLSVFNCSKVDQPQAGFLSSVRSAIASLEEVII